MIRKKRMSKGIAKILSGLLIFGMVAGLVPAVPGGTVHAKAEGYGLPEDAPPSRIAANVLGMRIWNRIAA